MKRWFTACLALALLVPGYAFAQSAFTGTWKTDINSMQGTGKPFVVHLKDGQFECNCEPPVKVKADGADHAVTGHAGFDTVAVSVPNDHRFQETDKKGGKVVQSVTFTVAADGKTGTYEFTRHRVSDPVTWTLLLDRIGEGAPGSNATAGTWRFKRFEHVSDNALTATYHVDGDKVSFNDHVGGSYVAKLDGKAVPFTAESGIAGTTVAVKRVGSDGLRETFYRNGKAINWDTMTVAADGKSMKTVNHDARTDRDMTTVAYKQ